MMGTQSRAPPTEAPPAYRYMTKFYRRDLKPVVIAMSLITAIWALAWTVSSFKQLSLADSSDLPKLTPLAITQGVIYAIACAFQVFGVVAAATKRFALIRIYAFLCGFSTLLVIGVGLMRIITHFTFKSDLLDECITVAQTGSTSSIFGLWGSSPDDLMNQDQATQYCNDEWSHDSWAEIIALILELLLGLLFTSLAFAYYRQSADPASPANTSRLPSSHTRGDDYPTSYNPPYDSTAYVPVYLPPPGPPPTDGKPPEYKPSSYMSFGDHKDAKEDDPFAEYDSPSVPMPTHWVEDREATPRA